MATKTLGPGGYTDAATYCAYLDALNTLTEPEIGEFSNGEFDGGGFTLSGFTTDATNRLILRPAAGAKFSGNPMRYGDGARILFNDGVNGFTIYVGHVTFEDLAIKCTTDNSHAIFTSWHPVGCIARNLLIECGAVQGALVTDSSGWSAIENVHVIRTGGNQFAFNFGFCTLTLKNCSVINLGSAQTQFAYRTDTANITYINCLSYGYPNDFQNTSNGIAAGTKNCATSNASGSSALTVGTGHQYDLASTDFVSVTNGSHDLRVAAGSTKLKDLGAASGGTTTDILGASVSGSARDIGPHEYQSAGGGGSELLPKLVQHGAFL